MPARDHGGDDRDDEALELPDSIDEEPIDHEQIDDEDLDLDTLGPLRESSLGEEPLDVGEDLDAPAGASALDADDEASVDIGAVDVVGEDALPSEPAELELEDDDAPLFDDRATLAGDEAGEVDPGDDGGAFEDAGEGAEGDDRGDEGTGDDPTQGELELPPLDAGDEGADGIDPGLERSLFGGEERRWEPREVLTGDFGCVACDGDVVIAGGALLSVRVGDGPWWRGDLGEPVHACATAEGRIVVATPTRVLEASASELIGGDPRARLVEHALEGARQVALVRGRAVVLDRRGTLSSFDHGRVTSARSGVCALAATAGGLILVTRGPAGELGLERRRGDDDAGARPLRAALPPDADGDLACSASPAGDVALIARGVVHVSRGASESFDVAPVDRAVAACFVDGGGAPRVAIAARSTSGLTILLAADQAGAESTVTLTPTAELEGRVGLAWDGVRERLWVATPSGLFELTRSASH